MIRRIVSVTLHQPLMVLFALGLFIVAGLAAFRALPVEAFPDVTDTQVTVITLYPGRAAEEVERQVTVPLEIGLAGLPNAVKMVSHTQFGLSYVIITFNDKAEMYFARQRVIERLGGIDLPDGASTELAPLSTAIGEVYRYRLRGDHLDSTELRTIQDWVAVRQLKQVPGVAEVVTLGGRIKQYEVNPDLNKLKDYKITLQQLFDALKRGSVNAGGGYLNHGQQQYLIRGIGLLRSPDDIGNIVIEERSSTPILVKHIATVTVGQVPRQGAAGQDDDDDAVTAIVIMRKGENPSDVLEGIKEKVDQLNNGILPPGVQVVPFYDRSWLIGKTLHTVFGNLVEGAMLVSLVLFVFLGNLRAALIVALMMPLSLLGTFLGLTFIGIPANLLSLGAMDFGIIVDGAVIIVENIFRRLSEAGTAANRRARLRTILEAASEVGRPTLFSMLIIIAAHIPIFTLQRHEGRIFAPMAYSVTAALITALILSLTLVPVLCHLLLGKKIPHEDNRLVTWLKNRYEPLVAWSITHARKVIGIAVVALVASLALVPKLGSEFLPELNEGSIWIAATLPASVSLDEAVATAHEIRARLREIPEIKAVISKLGRPEDGTDPKSINMTEYLVEMVPENEWRKGETKASLMREMERKVEFLPGLDASFSQPIRDNVLESIAQIKGQIVIKLFGDDLAVLRDETRKLLHAVENVPGVALAFIDREGELPQVQVEIQRSEAARYGLNVADIQDVIEMALGGKAATELWEGERRFDVAVRLDSAARTLASIPSILLSTPAGAFVPLSEVATFRTVGGSMNISRDDGKRVRAVGVFIRDRDMGSVVADMQRKVRDEIKLPPGYQLAWSGEFESQQRAMKRLAVIVPVSILLIFVLLFNAFGSVKSAVVITLNIPLALIGGILALFVTGIPLSVSAAVGFIALFGQAVLNGVVMVTYFNERVREGVDIVGAVKEGALVRMRTVLMTSLLAMLGLLPMATSTAIGSETQRPLAVVVIGGLISALVLTLLVLPAIYALLIKPRDLVLPPEEEFDAERTAPATDAH
ncbi:MAG: CusA/CzcA family heavy metal efflux RND transporter [Burkholderiaceae bacterium]